MTQSSDFNSQVFNIKPYVLIDDLSDSEVYIGISNSLNLEHKSVWQIKRFTVIAGIHKFTYPDGKQDFNYIWNDRFTYAYQ